ETQLIFEVRGLKSKPYLGKGVDNILHFEAGTVAGNQFTPKGSGKSEPVQRVEYRRRPGASDAPRGVDPHFANFIAAVRSRKVEDLNADILEGHLSSALCHLANMSYRLGEQVPFIPRTRASAITSNPDAEDALARMEEYLAGENNLKLEEMKLT